MIKSILVIPDSHATSGISNERFDWLGAYIVHKQPDVIINIGDFCDMPSLSHYDKGKKQIEGYTYAGDIEAVHDANERLWAPTHKYNKQQLRQGLPAYNPRKVITLGNHEWRIVRAANESPAMWGTLKLSDLEYEKHGWEVIPYLVPFEVEGIIFQHLFTKGAMARPIGGENHARTLTTIDGRSRVQGHSHYWKGHFNNDGGKPRYGLVAGCYFQHEMHYVNIDPQLEYWRGVFMLHNFVNGSFTPTPVPMHYIQEEFGNGSTTQVFDETTCIFGKEVREARRRALSAANPQLIEQPLDLPVVHPKGKKQADLNAETVKLYENEIAELKRQLAQNKGRSLNDYAQEVYESSIKPNQVNQIIYCANHPDTKQKAKGLCRKCYWYKYNK